MRLMVLAACAVACAGQSVSAELIYSKSRRFRIPFQFDQSELKRIGAKEVRLYASRDNSQWEVAETAVLTESRFTFEAPDDGVYWFSVKSRASNGVDYPPGPHQASLNVLVDTAVPALELTLQEVEPGRVRLSWAADDEHLDLNSLQLEFMEPGAQVWQSVAIRSQDRGQTSWTAEQSGILQVRGRVADLAGNVTLATATTEMAGAPSRANERPDVGKPVANQFEMFNTVEANSEFQVMSPEPKRISAPAANVPVSMASAGPVPQPLNTPLPHISQQNAPSRSSARYMNSGMFRIAYNLQDIGPSGVSQVDLYITEDGGRQWFHYGLDPDRVSPMEVSVPRDGEYGFAFRVTNGLGRVALPPQPGEAPEIRIIVDRTSPVARLDSVRPAGQADQNQVLISWTTPDTDLPERPIALSYSVSPTGPWIPIQNWQPNVGRLVWSVPPTLNQSFYIRLEIRDIAGNVSRVVSDSPFLIDRSQPRAQVTDVESLNSLPQ